MPIRKRSGCIVAMALVAVVAAQAGSQAPGAGLRPMAESPAPPDPLKVTLGSGLQLLGAAARLDIKHTATGVAPTIELVVSASDDVGHNWTAHAMAPPGFADKRSLTVPVQDRPLQPGVASLQWRSTDAGNVEFARSGSLQMVLKAGRVSGRAYGAGPRHAAHFEGPYVVSCSVPASALGAGPAAPAASDAPPVLMLDERFESALCRPYADWARRM